MREGGLIITPSTRQLPASKIQILDPRVAEKCHAGASQCAAVSGREPCGSVCVEVQSGTGAGQGLAMGQRGGCSGAHCPTTYIFRQRLPTGSAGKTSHLFLSLPSPRPSPKAPDYDTWFTDCPRTAAGGGG